MATTVLEALMNAKTNFETLGRAGLEQHPIYLIAIEQLCNGIKALENGKLRQEIIQDGIASPMEAEST